MIVVLKSDGGCKFARSSTTDPEIAEETVSDNVVNRRRKRGEAMKEVERSL
jgi:hypothetical protein